LKKLDSEINNNEKSFIHLSLQEVKILNDLLDKLRG